MEENPVVADSPSAGSAADGTSNATSSSGLFGSLGGIISTIIGGIYARKRQQAAFAQQEKMLQLEQQFSSEEAQKAREWVDAPNEYARMVDAGFNPALAAQSVMGGSPQQANNAYSPTAPNVPQYDAQVASLLGNQLGNAFNNLKTMAEIKNLESQTNKNNVEAGEIPLTESARRELWKAEGSRIFHLNEKTDAERKKIEEETKFIEPLSQAQYNELSSRCITNVTHGILNIQQALTEEKKREVMEHEEKALDAAAMQSKSMSEYYDSAKESVDLANKDTKIAQEVGTMFADLPIPLEKKQFLGHYVQNALRSGTDKEVVKKFVLDEISPYLDYALALDGKMKSGEAKNVTRARLENYGQNILMDLGEGVVNVPSAFASGLGGGLGFKFGGLFGKKNPTLKPYKEYTGKVPAWYLD